MIKDVEAVSPVDVTARQQLVKGGGEQGKRSRVGETISNRETAMARGDDGDGDGDES